MYLDSAIIVKLLIREPDSDWFGKNLQGHHFETSELALTEVNSALLSRERQRFISVKESANAKEKFESMLASELIRLLPLNRAVLERAGAIQRACHLHMSLKTLDALHVATCDLHREKMCATDGRIRAACQQLGIELLPKEADELPR